MIVGALHNNFPVRMFFDSLCTAAPSTQKKTEKGIFFNPQGFCRIILKLVCLHKLHLTVSESSSLSGVHRVAVHF